MGYFVAVHMFVDDNGPLRNCFNQDNGAATNRMTTHKFLFKETESREKIVTTVLKPIGFNEKIAYMRIVAHGDAGGMRFAGLWAPQWVDPEYRRFQSWFQPHGWLQLHGCGLASETSIIRDGASAYDPGIGGVKAGTFTGRSDGLGLRFLRAVASTFGVMVTAGVDFQIVSPNDWEFDHDTVTVQPSGSFRLDSTDTRGMSDTDREHCAEGEFRQIKNDLYNKKRLIEAREKFQILIRNYPRTKTANEARKLVSQIDHPTAPPPPMVPD